MKTYMLPTVAAAAFLVAGAASHAQDYEGQVKDSLNDYATSGQFSNVSLNVACRHLPAMDFIEKHKGLFESFTGAKINFTDYPENDLRSHIVSDASNAAAGFQIYCLDDNYVPLFATNNWVLPIGQQIKPAYDLGDLFDSLRGVYSWKDQLYGLPIYSEVTILYYRKDLFDDAKMQPPGTLAELEQDAAKLKQPPRIFGISLRGLRGEGMNVYPWTEWLRSYGGDFLGPKMEPVFNSSEGIEATAHYADLIQKDGPPGSGTWGWPQVSSAFAAGRVAMIIESSAFYPTFNDPKQSNIAGKIGYAVVPAGPKGRFPANYSIGLAIASTVKDSKQRDAALAFLQWATSKQMEFARTAQDIGNEDRKSVSSSDLLKGKLDPTYIAVTAESQRITQPEYRPMIPQWREMGDILGAQLEAAFTGEKTPKAALDAAAQQVAERFKAEGVLGTPRPYEEIFPANNQ